MHSIETRSVGSLALEPSQVRRHQGTEAHRRLTDSIRRHGILQPPGIRADGTVLWGNGRLLAVRELGRKDVEVVVLDRAMSEDEFLVLSLVENMHRTELTGFEQWQGCEKFRSLNLDAPLKELADRLSLTPSTLTRLLSPSKTIPEVQAALEAARIGISDCYELSKRPADEQADLLAKKLAGASRDDIARAGGRRQQSAKAAATSNRIRIELGDGVIVTFSGRALTLESAIDAAAEAGRALKQGRAQGLTAKTIAKISRERSQTRGEQ